MNVNFYNNCDVDIIFHTDFKICSTNKHDIFWYSEWRLVIAIFVCCCLEMSSTISQDFGNITTAGISTERMSLFTDGALTPFTVRSSILLSVSLVVGASISAGLPANGIVIYASYRCRHLRNAVHILPILNLSIAYMISCSLASPILLVLLEMEPDNSPPPDLCTFMDFLLVQGSVVQLLTTLVIGYDRHHMLAHPFEKSQRIKRVKLGILLSWVVSVSLGIIGCTAFPESPVMLLCERTSWRQMQSESLLTYMFGSYVLAPLGFTMTLVFILLYLRIGLLIHHHSNHGKRTGLGLAAVNRVAAFSGTPTPIEVAAISESGPVHYKSKDISTAKSKKPRGINKIHPLESTNVAHSKQEITINQTEFRETKRVSFDNDASTLVPNLGDNECVLSPDALLRKKPASHEGSLAVPAGLTSTTQSSDVVVSWRSELTERDIEGIQNILMETPDSFPVSDSKRSSLTLDTTNPSVIRPGAFVAKPNRVNSAQNISVRQMIPRPQRSLSASFLGENLHRDRKSSIDVNSGLSPIPGSSTSDTNQKRTGHEKRGRFSKISCQGRSIGSVVEVHDVDGHVLKVHTRREDVVGAVCLRTQENRLKGRRRLEARATRRIGAVIAWFLLCWLPLPIVMVACTQMDNSGYDVQVMAAESFLMTLGLSLLAPAFNPLLYTLANKQLLNELTRIKRNMKDWFCRCSLTNIAYWEGLGWEDFDAWGRYLGQG